MSKNAKVQRNQENVNVLVDTDNSSNRHYSSLDKRVTLDRVLADDEIIKLWENRTGNDKLKLAKDWIKRQNGYSVSNCVDDTLNIDFGSIVKYD